MMRVSIKTILVLGMAVLLVSPALAQQRQRGQGQGQGQRGPRGGGGLAVLLQNESVQKELKIDKEQGDKVKEAVQKVQEKHRDDFAKLRDLGDDERRQKGQELAKTVNDETLAALADVLKPEQVKRLRQIEMQQAGARAFTRPDVQKAMNLSAEQQDSIKTIVEDAAKTQRELQQGGNRQEAFQKIAAIRKETMEKAQKVLNGDQKKTWKELTGDPFELQRGQGRRGGRANT
jgi:hypothetical protein